MEKKERVKHSVENQCTILSKLYRSGKTQNILCCIDVQKKILFIAF
jgi:hypothetical protein